MRYLSPLQSIRLFLGELPAAYTGLVCSHMEILPRAQWWINERANDRHGLPAKCEEAAPSAIRITQATVISKQGLSSVLYLLLARFQCVYISFVCTCNVFWCFWISELRRACQWGIQVCPNKNQLNMRVHYFQESVFVPKRHTVCFVVYPSGLRIFILFRAACLSSRICAPCTGTAAVYLTSSLMSWVIRMPRGSGVTVWKRTRPNRCARTYSMSLRILSSSVRFWTVLLIAVTVVIIRKRASINVYPFRFRSKFF